MLDKLTVESFAGQVGSRFELVEGAASLPLDLAEVRRLGKPPARGRQQFSLLFSGPLAPVLPQRIYNLRHAELGELAIFLVPIGPDGGRQRYEAVFT